MKKPSLNEILEQWEREKKPEKETGVNKWEDDIPHFILSFPDFEKLKDENELKHHGIKGQKWGRRNGPPYPLDEDDKSNLEKKEEKKFKNKSKKNENEGRKAAKKVLIAVGAIGVTALAGYGLYKYVGYKESLKHLNIDIPVKEKVGAEDSSEPIKDLFSEDGLASTIEKIEDNIEKHGEEIENSLPSRMKILEMIKNGDYSEDPSQLFDEEVWNSYSDEERRSLQFYTTHDGYRIANGILRGDSKEFIMQNAYSTLLTDVMLNEGYGEQLINSIKNAINKSPLKKDVTTYRGINTATLPKFLNMSAEDFSKLDPTNLRGLIISDSGFFSSSPVIGNAQDFAKAADQIVNKVDTGVVITTICKKGTKGIYIGDKSEAKWEKELLLNSGQKFRILDYELNDVGKIKGLVIEALLD